MNVAGKAFLKGRGQDNKPPYRKFWLMKRLGRKQERALLKTTLRKDEH